MLLTVLAAHAGAILSALPLGIREHAPLIGALTAAVLALVIWRLWRFTISPALYPDDPKELPYWIPSEYYEETLFLKCQPENTNSQQYWVRTAASLSSIYVPDLRATLQVMARLSLGTRVPCCREQGMFRSPTLLEGWH